MASAKPGNVYHTALGAERGGGGGRGGGNRAEEKKQQPGLLAFAHVQGINTPNCGQLPLPT